MSGYFQTLPVEGTSDPRQVALVVRNAMDGKLNATGTVTLTASSATTAVTDNRAGGESVILFMPTTANAAAELSTMYVSARAKQAFTITHANNAQTDRTFSYVILG
jgi:hypothetical protein